MDNSSLQQSPPPTQPPPTPVQPPQEPVAMPPEQPLPRSPAPAERPAWREALSTVGILLAALGVALFLIAFVFRSYQVEGASMESTLQNQDKLIIWKVPRTWARITSHQYIPKRGDIIIFQQSGLSAYGQADSKQLIKRVIGLPGDHVVVKDGAITIYNDAHPNGFNPDKTLGYNKDGHLPATTNDVDVTLASDQLFVCGDNRPDSLDSRTFGPITTDQVIGKLAFRLFPINEIKTF